MLAFKQVAEFACEPVDSSFASLSESVVFEQVRKTPGFYKGGNFYPTVPTQKPISAELRKNLGGRPTDYRAEYCDLVVEDMLDGFSLGAFAGRLGVDRRTINEWMSVHPEFSQAVARARQVRLRTWEMDANQVRQTGGNGSQASMIMFGLKNMDTEEWKERQEVNVKGELTLAALVESSLKTVNAPLIEHNQELTSNGSPTDP